MSTAKDIITEKQNIEEQITHMLDKVLNDDYEEDEAQDRTMYTNLTSSELEEKAIFMFEDRRNKKAFSSKPNLNQQIMKEVKGVLTPNESLMNRCEKKSKTSTFYQANPQVEMQMMFMQFNQNYIFNPQDMAEMQNQMRNLNLSHNSQFSNSPQSTGNLEEYVEAVLKSCEKIEEEAYLKLKGLYLKIIMTQNGSRLLQKAIKKTSKEILSLILDEILGHIGELIMDPYANYFCQKFFISLKTADRVKLLQKISPYLLDICKDKIGTYPLQAFIEQLNSIEEKQIVIEALGEHIYDLCFVRK